MRNHCLLPRADFPVLQRVINGFPIMYLDSASTTLKPHSVIQREMEYYLCFSGNIHRGNHLLSEEASDAYEAARCSVANLFKVAPRQVIFVRNATEAINIVASGLRLTHNDSVLLPSTEHHSNLIPWMRSATIDWIDHDPCVALDVDRVRSALQQTRPKLFGFSYASNVTGVIHPAAELCALARQSGVLTCLDASQAVGHIPISFQDIGCDYLAFSGHKMMGPTGIGALIGRPHELERLDPLVLGGGAIRAVTRRGFDLLDIPHRLEGGTPNIAGAIGLAAAIEYFMQFDSEDVLEHGRALRAAIQTTIATLPARKRLMARDSPALPIGSVNLDIGSTNHATLATHLSGSFGILVRAGLHCAHPLFEDLGLSDGAIRVSAFHYNSVDEIERLLVALQSIFRRIAVS